jgi:N-acetylmuramoyl-L-alanine amidase
VPAPPQIVNLPSKHYSSRGGAAIAAIVIHHTAGTDSRSWLVSNPRGVSAHVLIRRDGVIYRLVDDELAAHHVGYARIVAGGRLYSRSSNPGPNQLTLGVELENLGDGREPYPAEQLAALGWQLVEWSRAHPQAALLFHRDIDTQGKTDPAGLSWPTVYAAMAPWLAPTPASPSPLYTAESPIVAPPGLSREQLARALARRCVNSPYGPDVVFALGEYVYDLCAPVQVDPVPVAAQICHETGNLTSARSQPPQHNVAGIGATNDGARGLSFPNLEAGVRAQVGRLLAYALPPERRTLAQEFLVTTALAARPLPPACHGSAPTLRLLGSAPNPAAQCGWAHPGTDYGAALARVANVLRSLV